MVMILLFDLIRDDALKMLRIRAFVLPVVEHCYRPIHGSGDPADRTGSDARISLPMHTFHDKVNDIGFWETGGIKLRSDVSVELAEV